MAKEIFSHLMFEGSTKEAMTLYVSLFPRSEIMEYTEYDSGENKGKLQFGKFLLNGRLFTCIDSPIKHNFSFTPALSIFVDCESSEELDRVFNILAEHGKVLMPLDNYGFSKLFGWVQDRFGVSWQLNLPSSTG